jgi:peroxiredoxin
MIQVTQPMPEGVLQERKNGEMISHNTLELFSDKKVVLFAVPGAFTPTCSEAHLPGYVVNSDEFKNKGVDHIICLSVNDVFVMSAWGEAQNAENIIMLADGDGSYTTQLGLEMPTGPFGGLRSQRYAMIVDDGVVTGLFVEKPKEFEASTAQNVLANL